MTIKTRLRKLDLEHRKSNPNAREYDNVDVKGLQPIIRAFLESIELPFEDINTQFSDIEYNHRDGFIPYRHNRGGMDLISYTNIHQLIGSGDHMGLTIHKWVDDQYKDSWKSVQESYPDLEPHSETFYEKLDALNYDYYSGLAYRVRVMYEGENTITVYSGYDTDAPYYRWSDPVEFEKTIKFKNKTDLKAKLKSLLPKIRKVQ